MLAAEEHALEIKVDLRVPDFLGHLHRAARRRAAHVVHQDVDTSELLDARLDHGGDRLAVGDVANMGGDAGRFLHRFLQACRIAVDGENLGAFFHEAHDGRAAIAPARPHRAGAGDDGDLVLKP